MQRLYLQPNIGVQEDGVGLPLQINIWFFKKRQRDLLIINLRHRKKDLPVCHVTINQRKCNVNMRMCCLIIETVTDTILGKKGKSEHSNKL